MVVRSSGPSGAGSGHHRSVWSLDPVVLQEQPLGISSLVVLTSSGPPGVGSGHRGSVWPLDPVVLQERALGIAGLCGPETQWSSGSGL